MPAPRPSIRERPHRLPHPCYLGQVAVFFTARARRGSRPLNQPGLARDLVNALAAGAFRHTCDVPIYCFMPDHVHLILRGRSPAADTWAAMCQFKQRSGYLFARSQVGIRWQKDFYDEILRDEFAFQRVTAYIAANPVKAGLARTMAEYPGLGSLSWEALVERARQASGVDGEGRTLCHRPPDPHASTQRRRRM